MFELILYIALIGLAVGLIVTYIPMPPVFKQVIQIIAAIGCIFMLLNYFGLFHGGHSL